MLILNPAAGRWMGVSTNPYTPADVVQALAANRIAVDIAETTGQGDAQRLAAEAVAAGYQLILAAGGDGTVHEVAQALVGTPVVLGILPLGRVMNLARMLNIPRDVPGAVRTLLTGQVAAIDVGRVNGEYFLEAAGAGIEAQILPITSEIARGHPGRLLDLLRELRGDLVRTMTLTVDGTTIHVRALTVTILNGPLYALMVDAAPGAKLDDGMLDVVIAGPMSVFGLLRYWTGHSGARRNLRRLQARTVAIHAPDHLPIHADTFPAGETPATFAIVPRALRVIVGPPAPGAGPTIG